MKRIIGIILSFATIFCLAACSCTGGGDTPTPEPPHRQHFADP